MPWVLVLSFASLVALVGAALAHQSYALAAYLILAGLFPLIPKERQRSLGVVLAWTGITGCLVAIARVPLGARVTAVYLPAMLVFALRLLILRLGPVKDWIAAHDKPRFRRPPQKLS